MEAKESTRTRIGFSRMEKKYEWKDHVIFMGILLAMAVWVNRGIEIKGLYMDDLYFWSCYGEQSFLQYVFPVGSTRFRFLYYLAAWLEMAVVRNHVGWFVPFNILLNAAVSWSIYFIGRRLSRAKGIGFLCGSMFLISRMAYYQIGQVLGLMETMALWMAVMILWYLFRYLNEKDSHVYFYGLKKGEETVLRIGEGKAITIKYIDMSEPDEDGYRNLTFEINGIMREVRILDKSREVKSDRKLKADKNNPAHLGSTIPGTVSKIFVKEGDAVEKNKVLMTVEAMKMETSVLSKVNGIVDKIYVHEGSAVSQEQLLISFKVDAEEVPSLDNMAKE